MKKFLIILITVLFFSCQGITEQDKFVKKPVISPAGGSFSEAISISISCETSDANIFYTLDGSIPSETSTHYSSAIIISETTTLKVIATKSGMQDSEVVTATYEIENIYSGTTVNILGPFSGVDVERFNNAMAAFEELTGINVVYENSDNFESVIIDRVNYFNAPDIACFPQPGFLAALVAAGYVQDMSNWLGLDYLQEHYMYSWIELATIGERIAGVWYRATVKSLV